MKVKAKDIPKIAFRRRYEHFEFLALSFELTNTPAVLMDLMNRVFKSLLDQFMVVFIDVILVYSKTKVERKKHLRCALQVIREKQLYAKLKYYKF